MSLFNVPLRFKNASSTFTDKLRCHYERKHICWQATLPLWTQLQGQVSQVFVHGLFEPPQSSAHAWSRQAPRSRAARCRSSAAASLFQVRREDHLMLYIHWTLTWVYAEVKQKWDFVGKLSPLLITSLLVCFAFYCKRKQNREDLVVSCMVHYVPDPQSCIASR